MKYSDTVITDITDVTNITAVWEKYENGVEHHNLLNLYSKTEQCYSFYESDQWKGLKSGPELPPFYNIIQPTVKFKSSMVTMNNMEIIYTPMNAKTQADLTPVCELLNKLAASKWENKKMDTRNWELIKAACITGDSYIYFYNSELDNQIIDNTNIYFGDEQQGDIQKQPYIIIYERRFVEDIKADAKKHDIPQSEIDLILSDDDTDKLIGEKNEVKNKNGKCSCLLYLTKKDGIVHIQRSTKNVVYQPDTAIDGLKSYPIASYIWLKKKNSSRGIGEAFQMLANQISINKQLANRETASKTASFPRAVYDPDKIENPDALLKTGVPIRVTNGAQGLDNAYKLMPPTPISPEAKTLQDEMIDRTRDLASAGNAALGDIDPTKASGIAITAVRDQSAIPLNEQVAAYKQYIEDIALIWFDMWVAYSTNGLEVDIEQDGQTATIPPERLNALKIHVKIDVSPTNPISRYAQEQSLESAMQGNKITFEEYVSALSDTSSTPKAKLEEILRKRAENSAVPPEIIQAIQQNPQLGQMVTQMVMQQMAATQGGEADAMPEMQY